MYTHRRDFVIEILNENSAKALERLYEYSDGLPFNELLLNDEEYIVLYNLNFICEPKANVMIPIYKTLVVCEHNGNVKITPQGKAYVETIKKEKQLNKIDNIKYIITTMIASLALLIALFK